MGLLALFGLVLAGFFIGIAAVTAVVLRVALWLLFLPFRLLFWAVALPLLLIKFLVLTILGVAAFGIVGLVGGALAIAFITVVLTPLLPLALFVLLVWGMFRLLRRPVAA